MKNFFKISILGLLFCFNFTFSQGLQESLDWINSKRLEAFDYSGTTVTQSGSNKLLVTNEKIRIENFDGTKWTSIGWKSINNIRTNDDIEGKHRIYIVSSFLKNDLALHISLSFKTEDVRDRFIKAIKHVVELNGAGKWVNSNYLTIEECLLWMKSRSIDVVEGTLKKRFSLDEFRIKEYYLDSTIIDEMSWKNIKDIKSYATSDNGIGRIELIGPTDENGKVQLLYIDIQDNVMEDYIRAIKFMATQNGANMVNDSLF